VSTQDKVTEDEIVGQVIASRWRVLARMGRSAQGALFRVERLEDGGLARLELFDQRHVRARGQLARFDREARIVSRLRHPRCLPVLEFDVHEGQPFLVTELPAGKRLSEELGTPQMTLARALAITTQVLEALRYTHAHGVIHRALVPEEVLLVESIGGELVKIGPPRVGPVDQTAEADTAGLPAQALYRAPELAKGEKTDPRGDLYAVGILLYALCIGREPLQVGDDSALGRGATLPAPRKAAPDRGISEALERVILRAIAKSPDARFQTASEFLGALEALGEGPAPRRLGRLPLALRTRPLLITGAVGLAGLAGMIVFLIASESGRTTAPTAGEVTVPEGEVTISETASTGAAVGPERLSAGGVTSAAPLPSSGAVADPSPPASPPARPRAARPPVRAQPIPPLGRGERKSAPDPVAPASVPAPEQTLETTSDRERAEIWQLVGKGQANLAKARIARVLDKEPEAAWPHLALGELYYRRLWRRDCLRHWMVAVDRDPELRRDPHLARRLCSILGPKWVEAGLDGLLDRLGEEAAPMLNRCLVSAKEPRGLAAASRAVDRVRSKAQSQ
jgi:eukaryotic-like serine/threonine-protein kinase